MIRTLARVCAVVWVLGSVPLLTALLIFALAGSVGSSAVKIIIGLGVCTVIVSLPAMLFIWVGWRKS